MSQYMYMETLSLHPHLILPEHGINLLLKEQFRLDEVEV